jgi:DNA-binding HxlR family transcriptional regulator
LTGGSGVANVSKIYGCPVEFSVDLLGGKWKSVILARLKQRPLRYGELRRLIPALSDKVLTERLHGLCQSGLLEQVGQEGVMHYQLSAHGETLRPILQALYDWGEANAGPLGAKIQLQD